MKTLVFIFFSFFSASWAVAQDDLRSLTDEFDHAQSLSNWKQYHEVEQFPDMRK